MKDIFSFFEKPKDPLSFSAIRISLASPEKIREWSHGEVKKPETINYRTFKPERDGLFCAKIFGSVKDLEKVLYCEAYIVIDPKETALTRGELLSEERYMQLQDEYGDDKFTAGMGGEAILEMLKGVDVHQMCETLRQEMR